MNKKQTIKIFCNYEQKLHHVNINKRQKSIIYAQQGR